MLVEKPLSARIDETESVLRLAEDRDRLVMVGYIERYDPRRAMIRQQVVSGELGEVVSVYARRNCGREYLDWPRFQRWPVIVEPGIHSVDMLIWLAGSAVTRVYAVGRSHNENGIIDTWWATLEFENGAVGAIEQVWQMPKGVAAEWDQDNFLEVIGTVGTSQMRDPSDAFWTWTSDKTLSRDYHLLPEVAGQVVGALRNELACFARRVRTGEHAGIATPEEIRHTTKVALAIVESATRRRPIDLA